MAALGLTPARAQAEAAAGTPSNGWGESRELFGLARLGWAWIDISAQCDEDRSLTVGAISAFGAFPD
jgi:hypothetical protein